MLLGPGYLAGRVAGGDPLNQTILAGSLGTIATVGLAPILPRLVGVHPTTCFIRRPTRRAIWWAIGGFGLAGILVISSAVVSSGAIVFSHPGRLGIARRLLAGAVLGLWTGTVEEVLFRGLLLSILGHRWHWPGAILVTSLAFGLLHNGHAETTLASTLYVFLTIIAGVLFSLMTLARGNVSSAIAVHASWNAAFSGYLVAWSASTPAPLVRIDQAGPTWLFGSQAVSVPESPLAIILFLLVTILYFCHRFGGKMR